MNWLLLGMKKRAMNKNLNKILQKVFSRPSKRVFRWNNEEYLNSPPTWESLSNSKLDTTETPKKI